MATDTPTALAPTTVSPRATAPPATAPPATPAARDPVTVDPGVHSVGARWPRSEAVSRVRGTLGHVRDQPADGCAHVAVHRSTRPHATIVDVDVDEALSAPGVIAVVTGADLYAAFGDRMFTGPAFSDQPPLAHGKVRYVGEPVAAVIAVELSSARAAVDLVAVTYEDLPPVHDLDTALSGTSYVHDELQPSAVFGDLRHLRGVRDTNVNYQFTLRHGDTCADVDAGVTVDGEFWAPPVHHVPIELPCTDAYFRQDRIDILSTTQTPSYVRQTVSDLLGLPLNRVRVRSAPLGGSFGAKMYDRLEPLAAALAWVSRQSVRVVASREEAFLLTTRHGARVVSRMTADADGTIRSASADVAYDTGAFADVGPRITGKSGMVSLGPYRIANASVRARCVYTNKPSAGPFRGFGVPQVAWSHESLVDDLARALGRDPAQYRREHLLREGDEAYMGTRMHSADFVSCLDAVTDAIGWDAPLEQPGGRWRRGRGVAVGMKAVLTPTVANAVLTLNQDNSAVLAISTVDMGQGSDTIMPQIVAEVLLLDQRSVRTVPVDTDTTPYDTITAGSRSTYHTGNAVRLAAEKMRDRLLELAARQTGHDTARLELVPGGVRDAITGVMTPTPELIRQHFGARGTTLTAEANFTTTWVPYDQNTGRSPKVTEHWFASAAAVDLRVDRRTGQICLDHLAVAADVGRAINPLMVEQQLRGAAIMGIGHALFEELVFDHGQMVNATLMDYTLPSILDVPSRLSTVIVETPHRDGPFGAKGVGESAIIPVCPAVANAVRDATGIRLTRLPLSRERVLTAMDEAGLPS